MATRPPKTVRVMVDTTVLVAGSVWPRFPYEVLQHALRGDFVLLVSPYCIAQARRVLAHRFPAFRQNFDAFLRLVSYEQVADPTPEEVAANLHLTRDKTDVPVGLAGINAHLDYLVSDDKDLTDPSQPIHQKLRILQSGTFLHEVMGWTHEELDRLKRRTWADVSE